MSTQTAGGGGASDHDGPMLHYRATEDAVAAPEEAKPRRRGLRPDSDSLADQILHWLTLAILGVVLTIWAVFGAIFWLPILIRTMFRFSLALIQSTMDDRRPEGSASMLRNAVGFYRRGFVVATEAVLREDPLGEGRIEREKIDGRRMVRELLWAAVIWYVVLWVIGVAWNPGELLAWVISWPWGEAFGSLVDGITGFIDTLVAPDAPAPDAAPAPGVAPVGDTAGAIAG